MSPPSPKGKLHLHSRRGGVVGHVGAAVQPRIAPGISPKGQVLLKPGSEVVVCGWPPKVVLQRPGQQLSALELKAREKPASLVNVHNNAGDSDTDGARLVADRQCR